MERLASIPGVARVVALAWALEMGDISRFASVKKAVSYCGLSGAENSSGGKTERTGLETKKQAFANHSRGSGETVELGFAVVAQRRNSRSHSLPTAPHAARPLHQATCQPEIRAWARSQYLPTSIRKPPRFHILT